MSKNVIVTDGNYKIVVPDNNSIVLDTGTSVGTVEITGNLLVKGTQTTVNSATLEIDDNIIVVNKNESANGVSETTAGLRVDRGGQTYEDVQFVYDESISWNDPQTQTTSQGPKGGGPQGPNFGGWAVTSASGDILSLRVANINNNNAIYFEPGGAGTLRVIRAGYEALLTDVNDIPNKKYVDDEISAVVLGANFPKIIQGDTEVKITDNSTSGTTSIIETKIDNVLYAKWKPSHLEIYNQMTDIGSIRIEDDVISGLNSNQDIEIQAPGTGSVRINDSLVVNNRPSLQDPQVDPQFDANGVKLYSKTPSGGNTGLYFVNTNDARGEVISTNRALLFGLIF
jgi:hypothetical protein